MCNGLLLLVHHTFDIDARHLHVAIGAHGDALLEVAREHTLAIVGDANLSLLTRSDRLLGIRRHGATAAGDGLVDDERLVAHVGEGKGCLLHRGTLIEGAKVVYHLLKLDFCLS